jgi:hypothetical protein
MPTRSVDREQGAVEDHERLALSHCDRLGQRGSQGGEYVGLADIAEHRGGADTEPDGQVRVGLAIAQNGDYQQGLCAHAVSPPSGTVLCLRRGVVRRPEW